MGSIKEKNDGRTTGSVEEENEKNAEGHEAKKGEREVSNFAMDVKRTLDGIEKLLIEKNGNYGDSALNPLRIFSKADSIEQIKVRIDDKLSRLSRGEKTISEDTVNDLLGYFVLYKIAENRKIEKPKF